METIAPTTTFRIRHSPRLLNDKTPLRSDDIRNAGEYLAKFTQIQRGLTNALSISRATRAGDRNPLITVRVAWAASTS
jgi:hypothetical protein